MDFDTLHEHNFEFGIVTEDEALIDQIQAYFERLWRGRECAHSWIVRSTPRRHGRGRCWQRLHGHV